MLYVGSLNKFKGPQILLQALNELQKDKQKYPYVCNFYGEGLMKNELKKYVKEKGLNAYFKGQVSYEQMHKIYSKHDIIIFPSLWPIKLPRAKPKSMRLKLLDVQLEKRPNGERSIKWFLTEMVIIITAG